jgi:cyclopropane fatty-acyl-phospholipid synthase-like methyltransferase
MPHRFEDPEAWAARFDDPARDAWQKPDRVVTALDLRGDEQVADIGAGTGYFAMRLARAVPSGKVFAADLEEGMVRYLGARAEREHLTNVVPVQATADDARLPGLANLVLVVDTYHHIEARVPYFAKLRARMTPGARLAIVDFRLESPMGPPPEFRLGEAAVTAELEAAGFRFVRAHAFLPHQYFLEFQAP